MAAQPLPAETDPLAEPDSIPPGGAETELERLRRRVAELEQVEARLLDAEQALLESERRYHQGFHVNQAIKLLIDPEGGRIIDANPAACDFYGYSRDELAAMAMDQINTLAPAEILAEMERAKTEQRMYFIFQHRLRSGELRDVEVYSGPIDFAGRRLLYSVIHDITERKQAEERQRRQKEYLAGLHETSLAVMGELHIAQLLEVVLVRAAALAGTSHGFIYLIEGDGSTMTRQVAIGDMGIYDTYHLRPGQGMVGMVWESGQTIVIDDYAAWRHRLPSSSPVPYHATVGLPLTSGAEVVGVLGLTHVVPGPAFSPDEVDVLSQFAHLASLALANATLFTALQRELAERQRAEVALRDANNRFEMAAAAVNSAIYDWDIARQELHWTDGMVKVFGYQREQIEPSIAWWDRHIHPDDRPRVEALLEQCLSQPGIDTFVAHYRFQTAAGAYRYIWDKGLFVRDLDGQAVRMVGSMTDLTEVKRAEEALRESEERYRRLVELSPDAIGVYGGGKILYVNSTALALLGAASPDEIIGRSVRDFIPPELQPQVAAAAAYAIENAIPLREATCLRLDGQTIAIEVASMPITYQGLPAAQVVSRDITERKQGEEQRRQLERKLLETQKLESLGILAGGIAHDFNNLLVAILGNIGLALLEVPAGAPAHATITQIEVAARRAADLTRQMLAYSGKGRFVTQLVDLNELVEEMAHLLHVSITKNAALRYDFARPLAPVEADVTQLRQVVMNLVVNASDAVGDQAGAITVRTGSVALRCADIDALYMAGDLREGEYVFLEVSDTGCGMDADTRARMFEPFFTTKFAGRGLGLAAVLGIVRGHFGALTVRSEPGAGTTIRLLLPASQEEAPAAPPAGRPIADTQRVPGGRGAILVVDDEQDVRHVTGRILQRLGYQALVAADGAGALALFRERRGEISAVLLDMTMPQMNGLETFKELRALQPDVLVVLMSGYSEQDATSRFAGQGLAGFLAKPFTIAELQEKLGELLGR